jgi:hypothetical protein
MANDFKIYTKPDYPYFRINFKTLVVSNDANWLILHKYMPWTPQAVVLLRYYKNYGDMVHKEKNDSAFFCKTRVEIKDES